MEWRSSNPTLKAFEGTWAAAEPTTMTVAGAVAKSTLLGAITFAAAAITWSRLGLGISNGAVVGATDMVYPVAIATGLGGFVLAMIIGSAPRTSPFLAPVYGAVEGACMGAVSSAIELRFPGIAIQAMGITLGSLCGMGMLYQLRIVRATAMFQRVVLTATSAIFLLYVASMLMRIFGFSMPYLHEASPIGIGISVVILTVASLNLILDFDQIEQGAATGAPKYMEWYAGFSLLVTLVWIYWEALRLLSKLRGRD